RAAGSLTGNRCGGPSREWRRENWVAEMVVPFGLSGPAIVLKLAEERSDACAASIGLGLSNTGRGYAITRFAGLLLDCGKCAVKAALPAAASEPLGGLVAPPKPAEWYPSAPAASPRNTI